jgi:hypothetical protein
MTLSRDFDLRSCLVRQLLSAGVGRRDIRHELPLDTGSSGGRANVVVLQTHALHGYELKSGQDTLTRLPQQIRRYGQSFDHVHIVADERHLVAINGDDSWRTVTYRHERRCLSRLLSSNPVECVLMARRSWTTAPCFMARLLWRDEAVRIGKILGVDKKTREGIIDWIAENACLRELRPLVVAELRTRELSAWESGFWQRFDLEAESSAA